MVVDKILQFGRVLSFCPLSLHVDVKRPIIRFIQEFNCSPAGSLRPVSVLCASLIISSICFQRLVYNHSDAVPSRVPPSTALIASAITVKFILSAVYPEVLYIINLILTEAHRPILMLAVKKKSC